MRSSLKHGAPVPTNWSPASSTMTSLVALALMAATTAAILWSSRHRGLSCLQLENASYVTA